MARISLREGLIVAAGVALFFWAVLPPDKVALDESCQPAGGPASFSAAIYGQKFWRTQLEAAGRERMDLLTQPARRARAEAELEREMRENPSQEEKIMRLSREQNRVDDRAEKERREAAAQSARLKRITWLMQCEAEIAGKLR